MCGIWARVFQNVTGSVPCDVETCSKDDEIRCRGPDLITQVTLENIELLGCLLHLRGSPTAQPFGKDKSWLLWNGELYGNNVFGSNEFNLDENDTEQIYNHLKTSSPLQFLSSIESCFAFIYLSNNELWFGRDYLGRRSLIISRTSSFFTISSVGPGTQVPTGGIFKLDLQSGHFHQVPWPYPELVTPSLFRFSSSQSSTLPFPESLEVSVRKRLVGVGDIGVLFSGGLDCSVLAFLICQNLPSHSQVFLLNVSFEENSPDRLTALKSFEELKKLHRLTRIVLVLIDVSQAEVSEEKERIIRLISSNDSRMDFSIATALFFASRGKGRDSDTGLPVEFNGKILMSGTGADEVFGGYSRYKSSFKHYGQEGVVREMSLDLDRLWHRNMGRDDRIVSCHARELRFPYLDSDFWLSLKNFSLDEVTRVDCPGNEKLLLRNYAKSLGFKETAQFPKRAIQFGTRISQVSNRQDFGSNRKAKGWQSMNKSKNQQISEEVEFCVKALEEKNRDQGEIEKIAEVILRLRDPDVSVNDKRHLMRVYLGDYVSSIQHSNELED